MDTRTKNKLKIDLKKKRKKSVEWNVKLLNLKIIV